RHTRLVSDWSSDVCSSDLLTMKHIVLVAGVFLAIQAAIHAQTTAFTYQGQLEDANGPVTGNYDLRFAVYNAGTNGNQIGAPFTKIGRASCRERVKVSEREV